MAGPLSVIGGKSLGWIIDISRKLLGATDSSLGFLGGVTLGPHKGLAVTSLQLQPLADRRRCRRRRRTRRTFTLLVRHLDGLAEMRDCFLEGGAAQRLVAGLAPPFDGIIGHAGLREVMRQRFRLG